MDSLKEPLHGFGGLVPLSSRWQIFQLHPYWKLLCRKRQAYKKQIFTSRSMLQKLGPLAPPGGQKEEHAEMFDVSNIWTCARFISEEWRAAPDVSPTTACWSKRHDAGLWTEMRRQLEAVD